jgi:hypothetical protein
LKNRSFFEKTERNEVENRNFVVLYYLIVRSFFLFLLVLPLILMGFFLISEDALADEKIIVNPYFSKQKMALPSGEQIEEITINGPPKPPPGFVRAKVSRAATDREAGVNVVNDVPAFSWSFGCSATSAAMIAGYYDRNGYPDMYTGPANNGVMPLDNDAYWSTWTDSCSETRNRCPLSATQKGLDGRTTRGHVDDYWICYNEGGPDPFVSNGWPEHEPEDCLADFMGTNQASDPINNTDGSTTFYYYESGGKLTADDLFNAGPEYYEKSGLCGIQEFYESRGYAVEKAYNQYIYPNPVYTEITQGFTFDDYKAQINAGRPVIIHIEGHTMVGTGYDENTNQIYIHDTWDHSVHVMQWGGVYPEDSDWDHFSVTIVVLAESGDPDPEPETGQFSIVPFLELLLLN